MHPVGLRRGKSCVKCENDEKLISGRPFSMGACPSMRLPLRTPGSRRSGWTAKWESLRVFRRGNLEYQGILGTTKIERGGAGSKARRKLAWVANFKAFFINFRSRAFRLGSGRASLTRIKTVKGHKSLFSWRKRGD